MKLLICSLLSVLCVTIQVNAQQFSKLYDLNRTPKEKNADGGSNIVILDNGDYFINAFTCTMPLFRYCQSNFVVDAKTLDVKSTDYFDTEFAGIYTGAPYSAKKMGNRVYSPYGIQNKYQQSGIAAYNLQGDTIFTRFYTDPLVYNEGAINLSISSDSSLYLVGERDSIPFRISWGYLQHLSANGDLLWAKTYMPTATIDTTNQNRFYSVEVLPNHNILVGGALIKQEYLKGVGNNNFGFHFQYPWMLLLDSSGKVLKDTLYSDHYYPGVYMYGGTIASDVNGGYFHYGMKDSMPHPYPNSIDYLGNFPSYVAHLDTNFRMTWRVSFPADSTKRYGNIFQVIQTRDSGYLVMGSRSQVYYFGWLCKLDKRGRISWEHFYYKDSTQPGYLVDAEERPEGGFVVVGWTTGCPGCGQDVWLLSVDSNGCELPGCNIKLAVNKPPVANGGLEWYPNPTQGAIHLQSVREGILAIYNLQGQKLAQYHLEKGTQTIQLPRSLSAGIYYGRFMGVNGASESIKISYEP